MKNLNSIGILPEPRFRISEHVHKYWEIIYYTHGTGTLKIGSTEILFEPGMIVCQPPNIPHSEISATGFRNIHFSVEFFDELNNSTYCFKDNDSKDLYNILNQIYREFHMKNRNWRNISEALLEPIHQYLVAWNDKKEEKNPWIEHLENIIIYNISNKNFKIIDAMKEIPLTINHFRYIFKKETGKTPLDYLIEKRINYAKNLLNAHQRNYTIKEISDHAGFDDQYYFSRVFKKVTGKSPTNYQQ